MAARQARRPDPLGGQLMHVITQDGKLWRTLPCPIPPGQRHRLQGVRLAGPAPCRKPPPRCSGGSPAGAASRSPASASRRGWPTRGQIVTVIPGDTGFRLIIDGETVAVVPRTASRDIGRYKAYATHPGRR